jgi:uncharacterized protein (TIGR03435 family)
MTTIQFLAEWALRSSILILSGTLLLWVLRVKDPSIRLAAWTAMLCGSLAIPALTATLPKVPLTVIRVPARPVTVPAIVNEAPPALAHLEFSQDHSAAQGAAVPRRVDWARAGWMTAVMIYILVAGALLLRVCAGLAMSLRLLRGSRATERVAEGVEIRESDRVASPMVLGIVRRAIVLPGDWREWDSAKLDAVLAHERSHIRRHDPAVQLLSAIHRALLWHSPLSWFLNRRIVRLAEEASDDAAVATIRDRASYAEALLDFMQRGVRSASWQGVPMARYGRPEQRIHRILDATTITRGVTKLSIVAIMALGAPLAYVVAEARPESAPQAQAASAVPAPASPPAPQTPVVPAQQKPPAPQAPVAAKPPDVPETAAQPEFEVASVKPSVPGVSRPWAIKGGPGTSDPGRLTIDSWPLESLILTAYDVKDYQLTGPEWLIGNFGPNSAQFDIVAKIPEGATKEQFLLMLQNLLAKRFKLTLHHEMKEVPVYNLVVAKSGPKFTPSPSPKAPAPQDDGSPAARPKVTIGSDGFPVLPPGFSMAWVNDRARMRATNETMEKLADKLSAQLGRTVRDATGLTGEYSFDLYWVPDAVAASDLNAGPNLVEAVQTQLGLKLESAKGQVDVLVIDHVEKVPIGN